MNRRAVRTRAAIVVTALAAGSGLAACGGEGGVGAEPVPGSAAGGGETSGDSGSAADAKTPSRTALISADPSGMLAYLHDDVTADAGRITIELDNPSEVVHDVTIERDGRRLGATDRVTAGEATTKLELKPGTYTFYCSVTGHRTAGMEGTLKVE